MRHPSLIILALLIFQTGIAQEDYIPAPENLESREWFQDARFGLFIHWGIYSVLGDGEWVMNNKNIPISAYEKLPQFFNPIDFDANEWVQMAKDAGMQYITITSRHHDGFSMFGTAANDYNIIDRTPYGKDILKDLSVACQKEGIKLFFYYSLLDWRHPDYYPRGRTGNGIPDRLNSGDWDNYIEFMKTQLTELLTNYGPITGIWLDGHWDQKEWDGKKSGKVKADWHYDELYSLIHQLQPACLIGNNHHIAPIKGEDFQMFEKDLPGKNTTGWGTSEGDIGSLPFEVCETINGSWGFNLQDRKHKSRKELIHYIVKAAGYGSNLLLNVGPMPNGAIQEEHKKSLSELGHWLRDNGQTIYGTKAGPISPTDEIATTRKGNQVYLHILNPNQDIIFLEGFDGKIAEMIYFNSKKEAKYEIGKYGLIVELDDTQKDDLDTIIQITFK